MAILVKGQDFADGEQITATKLDNLVDNATFASGAVETGGGVQLNGSGQLKVAGNIDIGTSNLTATGTISLGTTSFNDNNITNVGSIALDTITNDGTDVTIDSSGDIILDADGAQIRIKDAGTERFVFNTDATPELDVSGGDFTIHANTSDADIIFTGNDGGSTITALTLDMSAAGAATFNDKITAVGTSVFTNLDISGDVDVDGTTNLDVVDIDGAVDMATTLSVAGDVTVDTTTLKVDSTNNRVGIGTASPSEELEVSATGVGLLVRNSDANQEAGIATVRGQRSDTNTSPASAGGISLESWNTSGATVVNEHLGSVYFGANHTSGSESNILGTASIAGIAEGTFSNSSTMPSAIAFRTGSAGQAIGVYNHYVGEVERMRIGSDGNVGIGTTSPEHSLSVFKDSAAARTEIGIDNTDQRLVLGSYFESGVAQYSTIQSTNNAETGAQSLVLQPDGGKVGIGTTLPDELLHVKGGSDRPLVVESTDAFCFISLNDNSTSAQSAVMIGAQGDDLRIDAGDSERIRVESNGNVGIGDESPSYKLDVNGTGRFVGQLTLDDEVLHNISGTQTRLPGYYAGTYGLEIEQTAQGSTIHMGRSNGNCMNIGADATAAGTDVNVVYFRDTGSGSPVATEVGKIIIDTTSTNYETSSDYRLKENEVDITDGIDRLKELKPYRFNFTRNPSKVVDGFFAHEVSPVVPESISGEKDQVDDEGNPVYQGIDQSKIVPLLTAALQEAVAKIEALEARVQTLEG